MNSHKIIRRDSNLNSLLLVIYIVVLLIAVPVLKAIIKNIFGVGEDSDTANPNVLNANNTYLAIGFFIQYCVLVPVAIWFSTRFKLSEKHNISKSFCKPQVPLGKVVKWIFVSIFVIYAIQFASTAVFSLLERFTGITLNPISLEPDGTEFSIIVNIVVTILLAPFFEEIFFRGLLFKNLEKYGAWLSIVLSSVMFGLWHGNYSQLFFAVGLGLCSGFLFAKTRSIIPSIILHLILNVLGGLITVFSFGLDTEKLAGDDIEAIVQYTMDNLVQILLVDVAAFVLFGFIITGFVLFIIQISKHLDEFRLGKPETDITSGKRIAAVWLAPVTVLIMVYSLTNTVLNALGIL
jgi:membrane protease YdiL (CAAX protease family)